MQDDNSPGSASSLVKVDTWKVEGGVQVPTIGVRPVEGADTLMEIGGKVLIHEGLVLGDVFIRGAGSIGGGVELPDDAHGISNGGKVREGGPGAGITLGSDVPGEVHQVALVGGARVVAVAVGLNSGGVVDGAEGLGGGGPVVRGVLRRGGHGQDGKVLGPEAGTGGRILPVLGGGVGIADIDDLVGVGLLGHCWVVVEEVGEGEDVPCGGGPTLGAGEGGDEGRSILQSTDLSLEPIACILAVGVGARVIPAGSILGLGLGGLDEGRALVFLLVGFPGVGSGHVGGKEYGVAGRSGGSELSLEGEL